MIRRVPRYVLVAFLIAVVALPAALAPATATATPTTLAPVTNDTPLSAYGGWVLWSEMRANGRWALTAWHDGVKTRLPVRTRATPFDVDVGPDGSGQAVALYSRCARDPTPTPGFQSVAGYFSPAGIPRWSTATRCRLYRLDLRRGSERSLQVPQPSGASDTTPSQWRGRIAFGRRLRGSDTSRLMLWSIRSGRLRRLPGGDLPHTCPPGERCPRSVFDGVLAQVDLGFKLAAFLWEVRAPTVSGVGPGFELFADTVSGDDRTLLASGATSGACGGTRPVAPNAAGSQVWFAYALYDCETVHTFLAQGDSTAGVIASHETTADLLWQLARDGDRLYSIRGPRPANPRSDDAPCLGDAGPCHLVMEQITHAPKGGGVPAEAEPPFL